MEKIITPKFKNISEAKQFLYGLGFKKSYPYNDYTMVQFRDDKGRNHLLNINPKNPNQIDTWRIQRPGEAMSEGVVGEFIGGGKTGRAFQIKSVVDESKLNNYTSNFDQNQNN